MLAIQARAYWPSWQTDAHVAVSRCERCAKYWRGKPPGLTRLKPFQAGGVWETVAMEFEGEIMSELCHLGGVSKVHSSFYKRRTIGVVERLNSTFQTMLTKRVKETQTDWPAHLPSSYLRIARLFTRLRDSVRTC
jgi:hypothetical protein